MWIAWNIDSNSISWPPKSIEEKINIFYQRALGWQLHIADLLANGGEPLGENERVRPLRHSGFAVLQICLSYFETIGHYEHGSGGSKDSFKKGCRSIFPALLKAYGNDSEELIEKLYTGARCGLYHNSITIVGVGLGQPGDGAPLAYDPARKVLAVSPERLPVFLKEHLEQFRIRLLDANNTELRHNFEHRFNGDNGI